MSTPFQPPTTDPIVTLLAVLAAIPARGSLNESALRALRPELIRVRAEVTRAERRRLIEPAEMEIAA